MLRFNFSNLLTVVVLASFMLQGIHLAEEPTAIKFYMLIIPLALIFGLFSRNKLAVIHWGEFCAVLFFSYMILAVLWAENQSLAIFKAVGIMLLAASYYVVRSRLADLKYGDLHNIVALGGVIVLSASIFYYLFGLMTLDQAILAESLVGSDRWHYGVYLEGRLIRMRGLFDSPNNLALVSIFFFFYYYYFANKCVRSGRGLSLLSLVLSLSATGLLSLLVPLFLVSVFVRRDVGLVRFFALFAIIISVLFFAFQGEVLDDIVGARLSRLNTASGRNELFAFSLDLIENAPFIGYGLNQSRVLFEEFRGFQSSHNGFLEAALDGGVIGLVLLLICWFAFLRLAWMLSMRVKNPFYISSGLSLFIFSQSNLLTFVELAILFFAVWFAFALRSREEVVWKV